jgi:hypothetical protein
VIVLDRDFVGMTVLPIRVIDQEVSCKTLILETTGYDELADVKAAAAERWVAAVNADGQHGTWRYVMARSVQAVREAITAAQT